jgi:hypothetical protein
MSQFASDKAQYLRQLSQSQGKSAQVQQHTEGEHQQTEQQRHRTEQQHQQTNQQYEHPLIEQQQPQVQQNEYQQRQTLPTSPSVSQLKQEQRQKPKATRQKPNSRQNQRQKQQQTQHEQEYLEQQQRQLHHYQKQQVSSQVQAQQHRSLHLGHPPLPQQQYRQLQQNQHQYTHQNQMQQQPPHTQAQQQNLYQQQISGIPFYGTDPSSAGATTVAASATTTAAALAAEAAESALGAVGVDDIGATANFFGPGQLLAPSPAIFDIGPRPPGASIGQLQGQLPAYTQHQSFLQQNQQRVPNTLAHHHAIMAQQPGLAARPADQMATVLLQPVHGHGPSVTMAGPHGTSILSPHMEQIVSSVMERAWNGNEMPESLTREQATSMLRYAVQAAKLVAQEEMTPVWAMMQEHRALIDRLQGSLDGPLNGEQQR